MDLNSLITLATTVFSMLIRSLEDFRFLRNRPLILSMEKNNGVMTLMLIGELKSMSTLQIFLETGPSRTKSLQSQFDFILLF